MNIPGPRTWEQIARALFQLLDDIDTADDIAKGDEKLYRDLVRRCHQGRFRYAVTDGYEVHFNTIDSREEQHGDASRIDELEVEYRAALAAEYTAGLEVEHLAALIENAKLRALLKEKTDE